MITVVVEGDTDVPIVTRLCQASGWDVRTPLIPAGGKGEIDKLLPGFARAGSGAPHLVVRDLDGDAPCAAEWMATKAPERRGRYFALRLAVRAVEAWFLADREGAAACLRVSPHKVPLAPDLERDPKLTLVNLARGSSKPAVRAALVPEKGAIRKSGRGYEGWLIAASQGWSFERARKNSPSLERAFTRLSELRQVWPGA